MPCERETYPRAWVVSCDAGICAPHVLNGHTTVSTGGRRPFVKWLVKSMSGRVLMRGSRGSNALLGTSAVRTSSSRAPPQQKPPLLTGGRVLTPR